MATKVRLTAEDLWKLGGGDTRRELVDGEVREMAPAGGVHGDVTARICRGMAEHVAGHGGGKVLVGDVGFVLELPYDRDRVRAPDVAFVTTARLPEGRLPAGFIRGAPDLAVEIAFLELATPLLPEAIEQLAAKSCTRISIVPVFLAQGRHLRHDVPSLLAGLQQRFPELALELWPALGETGPVLDAISAWIVDTVPRQVPERT